MTGARLCAWADRTAPPSCRTTAPATRSGTSTSSRPCSDCIGDCPPSVRRSSEAPRRWNAARRARLRDAAAEEIAAGGVRRDPARRSRPPADRSESLRELLVCRPASTGARRIAARSRSDGRRRAATPSTSRRCKRWSDERLTLTRRADGTIDAVFRYEGTTCTNMGRPLQFDYRVTLGPRDEGYPIREQRCEPAPATKATRRCAATSPNPRS